MFKFLYNLFKKSEKDIKEEIEEAPISLESYNWIALKKENGLYNLYEEDNTPILGMENLTWEQVKYLKNIYFQVGPGHYFEDKQLLELKNRGIIR